jgi:uncharacterized membrane-anchored protein YitT (DUF2179 family)
MLRKFFRHALDILLIAFGSALMGVAYASFLIPHRIVPGGVGGLSIILHHYLKTPVGITIIILNIPIFILGIRTLGKTFGVKSILGIILSALFIDFFSYGVRLPAITDNRILAAIYGGIILGVGLGIVFRGRGSTGGTDIIGQIINRYTNITTGMGILVTDFIIISLSGIVFRSFEIPLYGYLALFLSSRVLDFVVEGFSYARAVIIISEKPAEIAEGIMKDMDRGVTKLKGLGGYTDAEKDVLLVVVNRREVSIIRQLVKEKDPKAFVIINDVYEVLGKGFRSRG